MNYESLSSIIYRCKVGWWGDNCEKCYPYPGCVNGNCTRPWECNCKKGWGGMLCDEGKNVTGVYFDLYLGFAELNYCETHAGTCKNGAKCISLIKEEGNYKCLCREGTSGRNCEHSEFSTTVKPSTSTVVVNSTTHKNEPLLIDNET
jgi:hypothetical protein